METVLCPTDFSLSAEVAVRFRLDGNIRQTPGIGSPDDLQFIVALDEQSGIQTPEEDYGKIQSLKALTTYGGARLKPNIFKFTRSNPLGLNH
jgi:hypothetical protein